MKKIFMLLAIAGMFGVTSCGGDLCACVKDAGDDEDKAKACFAEGTSEEDAIKEYEAAKCDEAEGEEGGEGESH